MGFGVFDKFENVKYRILKKFLFIIIAVFFSFLVLVFERALLQYLYMY